MLASDPNPSTYGQTVTFTATVVAEDGTVPPDGEHVIFNLGGATLTGALEGGKATVGVVSLSAGNHQTTASYVGDSGFINSASVALPQRVDPVATTVTISASPNPGARNKPVTFSVTVSAGSFVPTGTVTLKVNGATVEAKSLANGTATFSRTFAAAGTYAITATYGGAGNFATSSSLTPVSETIR